MAYWLLKSEPTSYSIEDLAAKPRATDHWDGVRNYQARNFMRDGMKRGDQAFFYHSSCPQPAIVGIVEVVREAYPDPTAWDPRDHHYDPKSSPQAPRWFMVDVRLVRKTSRPITLRELKKQTELADLALVKAGNRLSVMPVTAAQWRHILKLE